jgi:hypothetical protein
MNPTRAKYELDAGTLPRWPSLGRLVAQLLALY